MNKESISSFLQSRGIEDTAYRRQVLETLYESTKPLSAHELLGRLCTGEEAMNKVTIYRILDLFVQNGVLERHHDGDKSWRYCMPSATGTHCHFYCRRCGGMECVRWTAPVEQVMDAIKARVEHVDIRFDGVCAACEKHSGKG